MKIHVYYVAFLRRFIHIQSLNMISQRLAYLDTPHPAIFFPQVLLHGPNNGFFLCSTGIIRLEMKSSVLVIQIQHPFVRCRNNGCLSWNGSRLGNNDLASRAFLTEEIPLATLIALRNAGTELPEVRLGFDVIVV